MSTSTPSIDPALSLALSAAGKDVGLLNVFLKIAFPSDVKSADARAHKAADLIRRVGKAAHTTPKFHFRALDNVLQVKAPTEFLRQLIREPEVVAASSAPPVESAMMKPINPRDVDEKSVDRPFHAPRRTIPRGSR